MANYGEYGGGPKPAPLQSARQVPNAAQHAASASSLSTQAAMPAGQVVALVREAMKAAVDDNQTKTADANGAELKAGITIDLSYRNIQTFPEEVVDIIKTELERYAVPEPPRGLFSLSTADSCMTD